MKTTINLIIIISFVLLSACTASQRLAKLIGKHPELAVADTLHLKDTIVIPPVEADTLFRLAELPQQVLINRGMMEMELRKQHDTLYLKGSCRPDTVFRTHEIPVEKIKLVKADTPNPVIAKIPWIAVGLAAVSIPAALLISRKSI